MRSPKLLVLTALVCLAAPACASADFGHVIAAGESLSSVAAADGLSVDQLAAANGVSSDSQLTAGATLQIPPQTAGAGEAAAATASGEGSPAATEQTSGSGSTSSSDSAGGSSSGEGGYTVQAGDTLSAIAAQDGTTVEQLAAANGLDPAGILPTGITLSIGGSSSAAAASSDSGSSASSSDAGTTGGGPQPTPETVTPQDVGQVAADHGVSPSLAEAIGDQESGFNNDLVSSTGATGVMQIEPGTWDYIDSDLATPPPLSPSSAQDNVRGGVLLLRSLLDQSGGDPSLAAAGYYQGLQSVREHGMYSDTEQYVNDVMALRQRFGGP
jgi:LysM repeat protein